MKKGKDPKGKDIRNGSGLNFEAQLAELRDALLPKLLSGEPRVPVAEELVEAKA
ncbi:MAG TPA: hypothetical protein VNZ64_25125 [Candidatus Acidoferrum sp.]|nr:hypothetical protein [Candidatus Acidoferrum sp.]